MTGALVIRTKADPSVDEEVNRQRHGHRQGIIEMTVKERGIMMQIGFDQRTVDEVGRQTDEENRVAPVTKTSVSLNKHRG